MHCAPSDKCEISSAVAERPGQLPLINGNQLTLFEAMPEIVLLINTNRTIEHMNQAAIAFFGDLRQGKASVGKDAHAITARLLEMVDTFLDTNSSNSEITILDGLHLRYYVTLFSSKKRGEFLYWLIIEKITAHGTVPKIAKTLHPSARRRAQ